ncbi:MAG TPA: carbohydrate kinase family protein [Aggregatilineales bacterium]|nr:carbohydrate kinase family protein [Aggregatilineales bacterium]
MSAPPSASSRPSDLALDVVVVGPLNIDLIVTGSAPHDVNALVEWMALSDVELNVAGSAGYPAQAFQKLGLRTGMLSIVAADALGEVIRHELKAHGLDVSRVRVAQNELSSIAIYMLLFGSKKRPLTGRPVQHQPWPAPLTAEDRAYAASARLIHIAGYLHYPAMWDDDIPSLLREARARGQMVSLDPQFPLYPVEGRWLPGIERLLPHTRVLLVDQDEARGITGLNDLNAAGAMLRAAGPDIVAIKRGSEGAVVYTGETVIEQPAQRVPEDEIADTIGAGDAFDAGFMAALLHGRSAAEAVAFASEVAAQSLRGHGAVRALSPELPRRLSTP